MDKRFLYEVRPARPIYIPGKIGGRKVFTALLTIEEVKTYMQYGPVYRKYADPNKGLVLVTGENIYKLHRDINEVDKPLNNKPVSELIKPAITEETTKVEESVSKKLKGEESTTVVEAVEEASVNEVVSKVEESTEDKVVTETENVVDTTPDIVTEANDGGDIEEPVSELNEEPEGEETISEPTEADEENTSNVETEETATDNESEVESSAEQGGENHQKPNNNNNVQFSNNKKKKHH